MLQATSGAPDALATPAAHFAPLAPARPVPPPRKALPGRPARPARRPRRVTALAAGFLLALVGLGTGVVAPAAPARAAALPGLKEAGRSGDRLTVAVRDAGGPDRTYTLVCRPAGGDHPDAERACATLDRQTRWGKDTFAPVPPDGPCTMQYGGPATARVTGTWAGRPVDARFDRSNGCEIARWDGLVPLLPDLRAGGRRS
ncbi:SSI family serine proteinase inhibitor [Streptomyces zinciresistens]|nr:SSI family serine proteinase inhibitor [Streptomyces zinciresistens]